MVAPVLPFSKLTRSVSTESGDVVGWERNVNGDCAVLEGNSVNGVGAIDEVLEGEESVNRGLLSTADFARLC